ncbi:hypothetical protein Pla100_49870 [Neorhodopirellula pilleata]|uniref:Uncharacterized protein n=1 Tax=Neorhodopirellula pilleata TaxID=2714738 RepID=A0A5C5ZWU0_9BACT|nr:hypothetical protein Pla100_49870 [Neorhodopirellula pilleata]
MILTHPSLTQRVTKNQCHRQNRNFKTDASGFDEDYEPIREDPCQSVANISNFTTHSSDFVVPLILTGTQFRHDALQTFENDFFGNGESIFDGLKSLIEETHQGELQEVPLAWMLWPITAGGLGLRSATVLCGQYQ